jgi:hypothetical protein
MLAIGLLLSSKLLMAMDRPLGPSVVFLTLPLPLPLLLVPPMLLDMAS